MKWWKRVGRTDLALGLIGWLLSMYIRLVYRTGRWQTVGGPIVEKFWSAGRPIIVAFWHGQLLMMPYVWPRSTPINMLVSQHPDGEIIARAIGHFGFVTIRGSSTRGGNKATRSLVRALAKDTSVGITPDAPRGPAGQASTGVIQLARLSGAPIVPFASIVSRRRILASWDRFQVALPFASGAYVWGEPIFVPRSADEAEVEELRALLEAALHRTTATAEQTVGIADNAPAKQTEQEI